MINRIFFFLFCIVSWQYSVAKLLSPQEALYRYNPQASLSGISTRSNAGTLQYTGYTDAGEAAIYIFGLSGEKGFIVMSADDIAAPVLGYSENGIFSIDSIPPQLRWWLEEYGKEIEYGRKNGFGDYTEGTRSSDSPIAPMIKSKWNQTAPFNKDCPTISATHALTGCVATAMAQIMNFWQYPERGTGSATIILPDSKESTLLLSSKTFDWDKMLDWYGGVYTTEQADAVAYLMKACGYSVDMSYNLSSSGALSVKAAIALVNNFKYNPNIGFKKREFYDAGEWEEMIYSELKAGRPVMYAGASTSVGHEFICDGYAGDGYYHFNWGWSGLSDGYYLLNALNPTNLGSGGGTGGGYNFSQEIIIGIQPTATAEEPKILCQLGNLSATSNSNIFTLKLTTDDKVGFWANMGITSMEVTMGVKLESVNGSGSVVRYVDVASGNLPAPDYKRNDDKIYSVSYKGFNGEQKVTIPQDLPDGKYKLTVCNKNRKSADSTYLPVLAQSDGYNYLYFTKSGKTYSIDNLQVPTAVIESVSLESKLYYGAACKIRLTIKNNSEKELTETYFPELMLSGKTVMKGNGVRINVGANSEVTEEFTTLFELEEGGKAPIMSTKYELGFYDPVSEQKYNWEKDVTMNVMTNEPQYELKDFVIENYEYLYIKLFNDLTVRRYNVTNPAVIPMSVKLSVNSGYWGWPVYVAVFSEEGMTSLSVTQFPEIPILNSGEDAILNVTFPFETENIGKTYFCVLYKFGANGFEQLPGIDPVAFKIDQSGIEEYEYENGFNIRYDEYTQEGIAISHNGIKDLTVFSLDGKSLVSGITEGGNQGKVNMSDLPKGIYILRAIDKGNNIKTLKIVR